MQAMPVPHSRRAKPPTADPGENNEKYVMSFSSSGKSSMNNFFVSPAQQRAANQSSIPRLTGAAKPAFGTWIWGKRQSFPQDRPWRSELRYNTVRHQRVSCCPGLLTAHSTTCLRPLSWALGTFLSPGEVENRKERCKGCSCIQ